MFVLEELHLKWLKLIMLSIDKHDIINDIDTTTFPYIKTAFPGVEYKVGWFTVLLNHTSVVDNDNGHVILSIKTFSNGIRGASLRNQCVSETMNT